MVQEINIYDLNDAPYNPRIKLQPGIPEYDKLKHSIETFGIVEPIVYNKRTGNVVGGHQRLQVLKDMGKQTVPCSVIDIDEDEEKLLNIALNKIKGQWDYGKLEELIKDLDSELAEATGFSAEEIALMQSDNSDLLEDNENEFYAWDEEEFNTEENGIHNYVISLIFQNTELAKEWADEENINVTFHKKSYTTVIRITGE